MPEILVLRREGQELKFQPTLEYPRPCLKTKQQNEGKHPSMPSGQSNLILVFDLLSDLAPENFLVPSQLL